MVSGWVTPWVCHRRGERMGSCPTDTTRAVNGPGPSWTIAEEWEGGFDAYTRQRRSDDDIRSVVADPDKRGAGYTLEKKLTYARERGYAAQALAPAATGVPDARLERVRDRLVVVVPHGWVSLRSRTAHHRSNIVRTKRRPVAINGNHR